MGIAVDRLADRRGAWGIPAKRTATGLLVDRGGMGSRDGTRRHHVAGGILKIFSREVAPRNKVICEGAMAKASARRSATAAVALPSSGLARTFIKTRSA